MIFASTEMRKAAGKMQKAAPQNQPDTFAGLAAEAFGADATGVMRVAAALANATALSDDPQAAAQLGNLVFCLCQQSGKRLCAKNFCLGIDNGEDGCPRVLSSLLPPAIED